MDTYCFWNISRDEILYYRGKLLICDTSKLYLFRGAFNRRAKSVGWNLNDDKVLAWRNEFDYVKLSKNFCKGEHIHTKPTYPKKVDCLYGIIISTTYNNLHSDNSDTDSEY